MAQQSWNTTDIVVEAVKVSAALLFLFFVFNDLTGKQVLQNLVFDWHWSRFVIIVIAYFVSKSFVGEQLSDLPLWQCLLYVFYCACVLTVFVGAVRYQTHGEKDLLASRLFVDLLLPASAGAYLARRQVSVRPMPNWLSKSIGWIDLGISGVLNTVVLGAVYIGMVVGFGIITWLMGKLIVERAEIGWYMLYAVPFLLISGVLFLFLAVLLPSILVRDWLNERRWRKRKHPD